MYGTFVLTPTKMTICMVLFGSFRMNLALSARKYRTYGTFSVKTQTFRQNPKPCYSSKCTICSAFFCQNGQEKTSACGCFSADKQMGKKYRTLRRKVAPTFLEVPLIRLQQKSRCKIMCMSQA